MMMKRMMTTKGETMMQMKMMTKDLAGKGNDVTLKSVGHLKLDLKPNLHCHHQLLQDRWVPKEHQANLLEGLHGTKNRGAGTYTPMRSQGLDEQRDATDVPT